MHSCSLVWPWSMSFIKSDLHSLDFVGNSFCMKLFNTSDIYYVFSTILVNKDDHNGILPDTLVWYTELHLKVAAWLSGNDVTHINEVILRWARLVLRWVTVSAFTPGTGHLSRYAIRHPWRSTQPGHPFMGRRNKYTSQREVTPCGRGVRQVWFVCGWQVKLCDPIVTHGPYQSALEMKGL